MTTPEIDSQRRRAHVARRLLVLVAAVALGLALQKVLRVRLDAIQALSERDMLAARAELATVFRVVGTLVFGLTGGLGAAIAAACRNARDAERFPPPGILAIGARRTITGPRAKTLTRVGFGLGIALLAASLAGGGLIWYAASVLLACRA